MVEIKFKKGLSLIETIVVSTLAVILVTIVSQFVSISLKNYRINQKTVAMEEKIADVMREFEFSTRAASEIISAGSDGISYYRYYDLTSPSPTKVRYFMAGNILEVGKTLPQGAPPNVSYPSENEEIVLLVDGVANGSSLFTYYDGNGVELTSPPDLMQLKMVDLKVSLNDFTAGNPKTVSGSTRVNLRNMKDNL